MTFRPVLFTAACLLPFASHALVIPPLPTGMCPLDAKVPEQSVVLDYLKDANEGSNTVVSAFASCDELSAISQKKAAGIRHYGAVLKPVMSESIPLDRKTYVATVATTLQSNNALLSSALTSARESAASATSANDLTNPQSMQATSPNVLFRNDDMLIFGVSQTNRISGKPVGVASTSALSLIGGAPVSVDLYAPMGSGAFTQSAATLKPFVAQLIAANP